MCLCITLSTLLLLLLSFAVVAIVHTDLELFYSACGAELRSFVLLDTAAGVAVLVACALFAWAPRPGVRVGIGLAACCLGLSAYLCGMTLVLRGRAL